MPIVLAAVTPVTPITGATATVARSPAIALKARNPVSAPMTERARDDEGTDFPAKSWRSYPCGRFRGVGDTKTSVSGQTPEVPNETMDDLNIAKVSSSVVTCGLRRTDPARTVAVTP